VPTLGSLHQVQSPGLLSHTQAPTPGPNAWSHYHRPPTLRLQHQPNTRFKFRLTPGPTRSQLPGLHAWSPHQAWHTPGPTLGSNTSPTCSVSTLRVQIYGLWSPLLRFNPGFLLLRVPIIRFNSLVSRLDPTFIRSNCLTPGLYTIFKSLVSTPGLTLGLHPPGSNACLTLRFNL
jgi:hypothetical protein